jgi:hypothetical protein
VQHLLMIGDKNDIVVETNAVRSASIHTLTTTDAAT